MQISRFETRQMLTPINLTKAKTPGFAATNASWSSAQRPRLLRIFRPVDGEYVHLICASLSADTIDPTIPYGGKYDGQLSRGNHPGMMDGHRCSSKDNAKTPVDVQHASDILVSHDIGVRPLNQNGPRVSTNVQSRFSQNLLSVLIVRIRLHNGLAYNHIL
jgi:hypothetical protein